MEDMDTNDRVSNDIPEDEDLIMGEVVQGEPDLFFLHHYLSEVYRKG